MTSLRKRTNDILAAIEKPEEGFVFDDFDARYTRAERKREKDAATFFYRDKTSFETKYDAEADGPDEPAWVTDAGNGRRALEAKVSHGTDGDETARDRVRKPGVVAVETDESVRARRKAAALRMVYRQMPDCAETLKGILKHGRDRKKTICALAKARKANGIRPKERERARRKYRRDLAKLFRLFVGVALTQGHRPF